MKSLYRNKLAARGRDNKATAKAEVKAVATLVPRGLKQRITDLILTGRDKSKFKGREFGCLSHFKHGMEVEVAWCIAIPPDVPRNIRIGKAEYRLVHRKRREEEAFGETDPRFSLCNGYKWRWWNPRVEEKTDSFFAPFPSSSADLLSLCLRGG